VIYVFATTDRQAGNERGADCRGQDLPRITARRRDVSCTTCTKARPIGALRVVEQWETMEDLIGARRQRAHEPCAR